MLTPYDEFPVHQTPYPFSRVPSTDYNWDEGYYYGILNPDEKLLLATGFRINPANDVISGYALLNVAGRQFTTRFSRCWRRDFNTVIGPYRMEVLEPLRKLRLVLEENESGQSFDILWEGSAPPSLEPHHYDESRGRATTDQSRYTQAGTVKGVVRLKDREWKVADGNWVGIRDHSWGLYAERPPLGPAARWLSPKQKKGNQRALRLWTVFRTGAVSGYWHIHEDADGVQGRFDDVFGAPFGGEFFRGWTDEKIELATGRHQTELAPGAKMIKRLEVFLRDTRGRDWRQIIEVDTPPFMPMTMGYTTGSWKDGGNFHTYHGSEELALEWDEFDFSKQPTLYTPYGIDGNSDTFAAAMGFDYTKPICGAEHLARITTIAPDGTSMVGAGQVEMFVNGPYKPWGLE